MLVAGVFAALDTLGMTDNTRAQHFLSLVVLTIFINILLTRTLFSTKMCLVLLNSFRRPTTI